MKREKFLWPLSQSHHRALMLSRRVREALADPSGGSKKIEEIKAEVRQFFEGELRTHFSDEEVLLDVLETYVGKDDPDIARVRNEHRSMEKIAFSGDGNELVIFAETLRSHVRFEEDILLGRIEGALSETEKRKLARI